MCLPIGKIIRVVSCNWRLSHSVNTELVVNMQRFDCQSEGRLFCVCVCVVLNEDFHINLLSDGYANARGC